MRIYNNTYKDLPVGTAALLVRIVVTKMTKTKSRIKFTDSAIDCRFLVESIICSSYFYIRAEMKLIIYTSYKFLR